MGAIPYNDTAVVDRPWDGPGAETKIKTPVTTASSKLWTWYDSGAADPDGDGMPDAKAAYKLPHHEVAGDGTIGAANVNGVRAALSRLGQSGTTIPSGDIAGVRSHLQRHLDKFNANRSSSSNDSAAPPSAVITSDSFLGIEPDERRRIMAQLRRDINRRRSNDPAERVLGVADISLGHSLIAQRLVTVGKTWAIRAELLAELEDLHGKTFVVDAARLSARQSKVDNRGGVAVVPLKGVITPSASIIDMLFGGGSGGLAQFMGDMRAALGDEDVKAIVIDVDSPGGTVDLVPEAAAQLRQMREQKPIVAVANTAADSAAYWLASQAHEVVVTPSGEAGSVGVYQMHKDLSGMSEQMGVKFSLISAGKYKIEGNPYEPLGTEAEAAAKQDVNDYYSMFVADVAAGRGVEDVPDVEDGLAFGGGRTLLAKRAVKAGLADRVATLGETVQRLSSGRARVKRTSAEDPDGVKPEAGNGHAGYTTEERGRLLNVLAQLRYPNHESGGTPA